MGVYASIADVADRYDGIMPADAQVTAFITEAELILTRPALTLTDRIAAGTTDLAGVKAVVCNMVMRRIDNPKGLKGEHAAEYGYYYDTSRPWSALDDTDRALLGLGAVSNTPGSIRTDLAVERSVPWGC